MNLKLLSTQDLVDFHEKVNRLHTGCVEKTYAIGAGRDTIYVSSDRRLNDLLWAWFLESFNELVDRFPKKFPTPGEAPGEIQ